MLNEILKTAFIFVIMGFLAPCAQAQGPQLVQAPAMYTRTFELPSTGTAAPIRFVVDRATAASMTFMLNNSPSSLGLKLPEGTILDLINPSDPRLEVSRTAPDSTQPGYPGVLLNVSLSTPPVGEYELLPAFTPMPPAGVRGTLQIILDSKTTAYMITGKNFYSFNEPVVATLMASWRDQKLTTVAIEVALQSLDNPNWISGPLAFLDDGLGADETANDGLFTLRMDSLPVGTYALMATLAGQSPDGVFKRTCTSRFKVSPQSARVIGTFTDRGIAGYLK